MQARKASVQNLLHDCALEVVAFIKESEIEHEERWVPAAQIKEALQLNFVAVPRASKQYGETGWMAILARMLEDEGALEYLKRGSRAYYRTIRI